MHPTNAVDAMVGRMKQTWGGGKFPGDLDGGVEIKSYSWNARYFYAGREEGGHANLVVTCVVVTTGLFVEDSGSAKR